MAPDIRPVSEADVGACYSLMCQLRPHLKSPDELIERVKRQMSDGYRLTALWGDERPKALAGFRVQENLVHGRFLYIDDLVAEKEERGMGHGAKLLGHLKAEGRALGCVKLVLDASLTNSLAHRFYFRHGLLAMALRFTSALG